MVPSEVLVVDRSLIKRKCLVLPKEKSENEKASLVGTDHLPYKAALPQKPVQPEPSTKETRARSQQGVVRAITAGYAMNGLSRFGEAPQLEVTFLVELKDGQLVQVPYSRVKLI